MIHKQRVKELSAACFKRCDTVLYKLQHIKQSMTTVVYCKGWHYGFTVEVGRCKPWQTGEAIVMCLNVSSSIQLLIAMTRMVCKLVNVCSSGNPTKLIHQVMLLTVPSVSSSHNTPIAAQTVYPPFRPSIFTSLVVLVHPLILTVVYRSLPLLLYWVSFS